MKSIVLAVVLIFVFSTIPVQAQTISAAQKAEIEKSLKDLFVQYIDTHRKLNAEASASFFSRDKLMGLNTSGQILTTIEAITKQIAAENATRKGQSFDIKDLKVNVISPTMAVVLASGKLTISALNGNVMNLSLAISDIWVNESNAWKIAQEAVTASF
jgi:hypothetical protein